MRKTKVPYRTLHESSFILLYLIPPLPVTQVAVHGDVAKSNGDPFYLYLHISSLTLSCPSLCWTWHARYLKRPLAEVYAVAYPPIPMRAARFDRLRETCQTRLKWSFCFVTCWLHRQVVSKSHVHKPNIEPATDLTPWREPTLWNSRSSEQSPSCPNSVPPSSPDKPLLLRFLSEAWKVKGVMPCTRLAPGKNASNISLMWWRLARRLQLSPWESSVVNRLLTPTHAFLARSKSTAALSGNSGKTVKVQLSVR